MTLTHAMILAAGFGTRMRPLTRTCPKPLLPVAGRPMIDLALDHVRDAGLSHAVVNLHYLGGMLRAHLSDRDDLNLAFSEEDPILDTGGGVAHALPLLGDRPFAVMNSDAIWTGENPLRTLISAWEPSRMGALILLVATDCARAYTRNGDFMMAGDRPVRRGAAPSAPFIYSGAQIVAPEVFDGMPDGAFSFNLIWDHLLAEGRLAAVVHPGEWVDVGTPEGLEEASTALAEARD